MRIGRPIPPLTLTDDERETLERWARRPTTAQALAQRARVILGCAADQTNTCVARTLRLTKQTVGKWRSRFLAKRLDGLLDDPRPGAPRPVHDAQVEQVVTLTLESKPRDARYWSTRAMGARCGLSQSTVSRIWRAFGLQPHRTETFKLSPDPLFVEKVRDIVGLYLDPPERALVLCVDERSQIQALEQERTDYVILVPRDREWVPRLREAGRLGRPAPCSRWSPARRSRRSARRRDRGRRSARRASSTGQHPRASTDPQSQNDESASARSRTGSNSGLVSSSSSHLPRTTLQGAREAVAPLEHRDLLAGQAGQEGLGPRLYSHRRTGSAG